MSTSMLTLVASPVLIPMLTALLCAASVRKPSLQRRISLAGALLFLAAGLTLVWITAAGTVPQARFGDWPTPFAIEFRIDRLGAAMIAVSALILSAVMLFPSQVGPNGQPSVWQRPLVHALMVGVGGAFATYDLFNLYVWFEVMLIAALGLLALGRQARHLEAAFKYLVLNLVGTLMLLTAVAGLYGLTGQLGYGALGAQLADPATPGLATVFVALLLLALLIKAGAFPFFFWLPAAYPSLATPVLALFAGLLTKVGVYGLMRVMGEIAPLQSETLLAPLGWLAVATMFAGVLGAAHHWDTRRILSFHIISQIGYIMLSIALGTAAGLAAAIFYTVHHIIVKANLFLVSGIIHHQTGRFDLRDAGGLFSRRPGLAVVFAIPALSLVGIPLLSGFWAKLLVVRACFEQGQYAWGGAALVVGGLTLYSMAKVWIEAFWKPQPHHADPELPAHHQAQPLARAVPGPAMIACASLALITLMIGLFPQAMLVFSDAAAISLSPIQFSGGAQ